MSTAEDQHLSPLGRELGSARNAVEQRVEEAIEKVGEWSGKAPSYASVGGGLSNSNWRITLSKIPQTYFMKIPGAGSEAFVDRVAASEASMRAADLGIAPNFVHFDAASGVEVIEYLDEYRACTNGELKLPEISGQIVELYRQLHASGPLPLTKTVFDMIDEHLSHARQLEVRLPPEIDSIVEEYEAAKTLMLASGLDLVPCHNDPMPGNFLVSPGKDMKLVDFEYASNNERAYELALIATEMFYDEQQMLSLVEMFYGATDWPIVSRVNVCSALADLKWGLWGCIKKELNDEGWPFDYQKYGLWKLMRAQTKMSDSRWGLWLASI